MRDWEKDVIVLSVFEKNGERRVRYMRRGIIGESSIRTSPYGEYFLARGARVFMDDLK